MSRLSSGLRSQMCTDLKTAFANGVLLLYSGTQPASSDNEETGTLLAIVTESGLAFTPGVATNGLNFDAVAHDALFTKTTLSKDAAETWSGTALAAGTIGYGRYYDNDKVMGESTVAIRFDGSASVSGGDFTVSTAQTKVGSPVTVDGLNINIPNK